MSFYRHTQWSPLGPAFAICGLGCFAALWFVDDPVSRTLCVTMGVVAGLIAGLFGQLRVEEQEDRLRVRFGPLPLFGTSVRYAHVRAVARARSSLLDGLGVHWFPGRGWTFNVWGFDCVELHTDRGLVRIGTDDPDELVRHVAQRTGGAAG